MTCKALLLRCLTVGFAACVTRTPGTVLEIEVAAVSSTPDARSQLTSDLGYHVQLDQLYIVLSRIELVPCPGARAGSVLRELFGTSVAYAHGQNTMTAWAVPNVLAPLVDNSPVAIAVLHPPAIAYCGVRVALEAADADAERMPSEIDMSGLSMFLTGTYGMDAQSAGLSFLYDSYASSTLVLPLRDSTGNPAAVELSEDNLQVRLRIEIAYQHMLDGLALYPGAFSTFGDVVLAAVLTHATAVVSE
jgi:hypothetical protein